MSGIDPKIAKDFMQQLKEADDAKDAELARQLGLSALERTAAELVGHHLTATLQKLLAVSLALSRIPDERRFCIGRYVLKSQLGLLETAQRGREAIGDDAALAACAAHIKDLTDQKD